MWNKSILENKEPGVILSKFTRLFWAKNANLHDNSYFRTIRSYNAIMGLLQCAMQCNVIAKKSYLNCIWKLRCIIIITCFFKVVYLAHEFRYSNNLFTKHARSTITMIVYTLEGLYYCLHFTAHLKKIPHTGDTNSLDRCG